MYIDLIRYSDTPDSTGALLFIDHQFVCYTIEDQLQTGPKIQGETRIPEGIYEIKFRDDGGMNKRYKEIYGDWHVGMLHLQEIPGFRWVYIHIGNTDDQTEGCILPGIGTLFDKDHTTQYSEKAYRKIYNAIKTAVFGKGEKVFIHVRSL